MVLLVPPRSLHSPDSAQHLGSPRVPVLACDPQMLSNRNEAGAFELALDVSGYAASDLKLDVNAKTRVLTVLGGHKDAAEAKWFQRSWTLPPSCDIEAVKSTLNKKGVLSIVAPEAKLKSQAQGTSVEMRTTAKKSLAEAVASANRSITVEESKTSSVRQSAENNRAASAVKSQDQVQAQTKMTMKKSVVESSFDTSSENIKIEGTQTHAFHQIPNTGDKRATSAAISAKSQDQAQALAKKAVKKSVAESSIETSSESIEVEETNVKSVRHVGESRRNVSSSVAKVIPVHRAAVREACLMEAASVDSVDHFEVVVDVRGFDASEIAASVANGLLVVSGSHEDRVGVTRQFRRMYPLPDGCTEKAAITVAQDGMATVVVAKKKEIASSGVRKIRVQKAN